MKILFIASEMVPYAKTGGLADVLGALPHALARRGHDVRVVIPRHQCVGVQQHQLQLLLPELWVNFPRERVKGKAYQTAVAVPGADRPLTVYFIDTPPLFDRPGVYGENGRDYPDNAFRFAWFNMAAVWLLKALDWSPDIIHCNDWQTALLPVFLRAQVKFRYDPFFARTRMLFSIHNLAYQGLCDSDLLERVGLPPTLFHAEQMEYWGVLSPLKGGIAHSDWISTVSPQYAREILTRPFGCGLDGFIGNRKDRLQGILNGIDTDAWDPGADPLIHKNYTLDDLGGKTQNKKYLQELLGLPADPKAPLLAMINRLDSQKGIELLLETLPRILKTGAQFVILGSGRPDYHARLISAMRQFPTQFQARLEFDDRLAHAIIAAADIFMILSRYEPCGLTQMYSLRYGTVPLVHHTGGLADTVADANPQSVAEGAATGFTFHDHSAEAFLRTLDRALHTYRDAPADWRAIQSNGMRKDHSWSRSAAQYERLYAHMLSQPSFFVPGWL